MNESATERLMAIATRLRNFAVADRPSLDEIATQIEECVDELDPA